MNFSKSSKIKPYKWVKYLKSRNIRTTKRALLKEGVWSNPCKRKKNSFSNGLMIKFIKFSQEIEEWRMSSLFETLYQYLK